MRFHCAIVLLLEPERRTALCVRAKPTCMASGLLFHPCWLRLHRVLTCKSVCQGVAADMVWAWLARSDYAGPVSSPFAAHTRQPFWDDSGSCRSRLSDYGYDTASDEEEEAEEQQLHAMAFEQDAGQQQEQQPPVKSPPPEERAGFWADVGASGSKLAQSEPSGHADLPLPESLLGASLVAVCGELGGFRLPHRHVASFSSCHPDSDALLPVGVAGSSDHHVVEDTDGGQCEIDDREYGFGSDIDTKPDQDLECAMDTQPMDTHYLDTHPHTPGVLLPWDMD